MIKKITSMELKARFYYFLSWVNSEEDNKLLIDNKAYIVNTKRYNEMKNLLTKKAYDFSHKSC